MREMKNSGVAWIGEIPKDWDLSRLKFSSTYNDESIKEDTNPEKEIEYVEIGSVTLENGVEKAEVMRFKDAPSRARRIARKGDIIISTVRTYLKAIALIEKESYTVSTGFCVIRPQKCMDSGYLKYFCSSELFTSEVSACSVGISYPAINASTLMDFHIINPPLTVQHKIVRVLDEKCNHVDSLIANVQAQIEKLKAYKQSLITEVVTKGLDPNAPMKDSGIEWAPKIPANWEMSRIGLHYSIILGKMLCPKPADDTYTLEPYYCAANVHFGNICSDELKKMWFSPYEKELYHVEVGDVLIVEGGAGAGGCAVVQQPTDTLVQNSVMIVRNKSNSDNRYLRYWVESLVGRGYIEVVCNKATIPHFTKEKLSRTVYPVMSPKEQVQIADFLDKKCSQIDQLISLKESKIEKLQQYKRSLIYEYVTGKKEVV